MNQLSKVPDFSQYTIIKILGQGGMGCVYLAKDKRLDRLVAIKCLNKSGIIESRRLIREARILAKINHPNIVHIYDIIDQGDQTAFIMEYVNGSTLKHYLKENIPTLKLRLTWLHQIAEGLEKSHQLGIIHRDIKLDNILVNEEGFIKITDFGIAKDQSISSHTNSLHGSYNAISPEQALGQKIDERSDLFSLGMIAYQLISGHHPFEDEYNHLVTIQNIIYKNHSSLTDIMPSINYELSLLIDQLLEKDKKLRPTNAQWVHQKIIYIKNKLSESSGNESSTILLKHETNNIRNLYKLSKTIKTALNNIKIHFTFKKLKSLPLILSTVSALIYFNKVETPYIIIQPPQKNTPHSENQFEDTKIAIYQTIHQTIMKSSKYKVISQSEVTNLNLTPTMMAKSVGADFIIVPFINCHKSKCQVSISKLDSTIGEVVNNVDYSLISESLINTRAITSTKIVELLNLENNFLKNSIEISEKDYERYIKMYKSIKLDGKSNAKTLKRIHSLIQSSPNFLPLYQLYTDTSLDVYQDTKNIEILNKLNHILRQEVRLLGNSLSLYVRKFHISLVNNEYDAAERHIQSISTMNHQEEVVHELNGILNYEKSLYQESIKSYKKSLKLRFSRSTYYNIALSYWSAGNTKDSRYYINKLLDISPEDYWGIQLLSTIELTLGNTSVARSLYQQLIEINPQAVNYNNLGLTHLLDKNYKKAISKFEKSVDISPNNTLWLLNLADSHKLLGNNNYSSKLYNQIISLTQHSKDWSDLRNRSQAFAHLNQPLEAIKTLSLIQKESSENAELIYNSALIYTLIGESKSAIFYIGKSLKNGINPIWFSLPWFQSLCTDIELQDLLKEYKGGTHCTSI